MLNYIRFSQMMKAFDRYLYKLNDFIIIMSITLQDIKLQTIDFDWIKQTTKLSHLKKAINLIQQDGNYYSQLKDACYARMEQLDHTCKRINFNNNVSTQIKANIDQELNQWESIVAQKLTKPEISETNLEDYQKYFDNQTNINDQKKNEQRAEKQRMKGNEAIKSKDFDQAISYYTKSIQLDSKSYQAFGNRALAHLKKKDYQQCITDCDKALSLNAIYTKALHRKAKALIGLKLRVEGYRCYKEIMKIEPENNEVNKQMMELRQEMSPEEIGRLQNSLIPKSQFKKITIQEDSDEQIQQK